MKPIISIFSVIFPKIARVQIHTDITIAKFIFYFVLSKVQINFLKINFQKFPEFSLLFVCLCARDSTPEFNLLLFLSLIVSEFSLLFFYLFQFVILITQALEMALLKPSYYSPPQVLSSIMFCLKIKFISKKIS